MRLSKNGNLIVERIIRGIFVARFARPDLRRFLDDQADSSTCHVFREFEESAFSELEEGWTLVVNIGLIEMANSAFYRCLLWIREALAARRCRLIICCPTAQHRELFELFGAFRLFTIVNTESAAILKAERWLKSPEPDEDQRLSISRRA